MKYTYEELKKFNTSYTQFFLNEDDVIKVNKIVSLIEAGRQDTPTDGDMVICISPEKGVVSDTGHLEKFGKDKTVCTDPYVSFVDTSLNFSTSGGYWKTVKKEDLQKFKKIGTTEKVFKTWGHNGMRADGAVYFKAKVTLWEYTDPYFY